MPQDRLRGSLSGISASPGARAPRRSPSRWSTARSQGCARGHTRHTRRTRRTGGRRPPSPGGPRWSASRRRGRGAVSAAARRRPKRRPSPPGGLRGLRVSDLAQIRAQPVLGTHADDHLLAVLPPGEVDVGVDLLGRQVAGRHLHQLFAGGRDRGDHRALDGDVADGRRHTVDHDAEAPRTGDGDAFARVATRHDPQVAARLVRVPDRDGERCAAPLRRVHRHGGHMRFGQELFTLFTGQGHSGDSSDCGGRCVGPHYPPERRPGRGRTHGEEGRGPRGRGLPDARGAGPTDAPGIPVRSPRRGSGTMAQDRSVRLRDATDRDAEEITAVFFASRAAALPGLRRVHSDEDTLAWITHVLLPGSRTWVAEGESGELLGFASLDGDELDQLYLRPDTVRQGVGTRLLERVKAASRGELSLYTFRRNSGARAFYERHGFVAVAYDDGSRNEENEPDVLYRWTAARRPGHPDVR